MGIPVTWISFADPCRVNEEVVEAIPVESVSRQAEHLARTSMKFGEASGLSALLRTECTKARAGCSGNVHEGCAISR